MMLLGAGLTAALQTWQCGGIGGGQQPAPRSEGRLQAGYLSELKFDGRLAAEDVH